MTADLFGQEELQQSGPRVFSVTEITRSVRAAIEDSLGTVWVEGEISNLRKQSSGHQYFTLKDAQAQLSCVLFARPGMWKKHVPLSDGMCVQVRGALTVYEARGQYQLNVQLVQAAGEGMLQAKFEALKRKLDAEGLFDPTGKKPLPTFPKTVAIVTSPTGAALRDMLHILGRRAPWLHVVISPVRVQGEGAAAEIAAAVTALNRMNTMGLDVIVLARGGGSAEDLWQFNEEIVARAIAASSIPVVSAVGHEIDFTIADFVADLRAPTPSAAAELIAPDSVEVLRRLQSFAGRMRREVGAGLQRQRRRLEFLSRGALSREPLHQLAGAAQRLDGASEALERAALERLSVGRRRVTDASAILRQHRPDQQLAWQRQRLAGLQRQLVERASKALSNHRQHVRRIREMLRVLSPEATLERGYTLTTTTDGTLLNRAALVRPGMKLRTRFQDGTVDSTSEGH